MSTIIEGWLVQNWLGQNRLVINQLIIYKSTRYKSNCWNLTGSISTCCKLTWHFDLFKFDIQNWIVNNFLFQNQLVQMEKRMKKMKKYINKKMQFQVPPTFLAVNLVENRSAILSQFATRPHSRPPRFPSQGICKGREKNAPVNELRMIYLPPGITRLKFRSVALQQAYGSFLVIEILLMQDTGMKWFPVLMPRICYSCLLWKCFPIFHLFIYSIFLYPIWAYYFTLTAGAFFSDSACRYSAICWTRA